MYSGEYHNEFALSGDDFPGYRRRSPGWVAFWTSLVVSVSTVLLLQLLVLPALRASQKRVVVPELSGLKATQATRILNSLGLRLERMARQADRKPAGTILSHVPAAGQPLKVGSPVRVILSLGPSSNDASDTPSAARKAPTPDAGAPQGRATARTPARRRAAPRSKAQVQPRPRSVRVPRLTNMSLSAAKRRIRKAGLRLRHISFGADEDKAPHWVLRQTPLPYRRVPRGSPVDLTINRDDL